MTAQPTTRPSPAPPPPSPASSPNPNQPPAGRRPKPYLLEPSPPLAPTRWSSLALCRRRRSLPLALYCRPALDLSSLDSTAAARLRPPAPVTTPSLASDRPNSGDRAAAPPPRRRSLTSSHLSLLSLPLLERCWG
ncbi:hypothetical protein PVAP13_2NG023714 [Panicum virgatum]|uniref:Uncharacterized protein n=1 Tax=Panicum virgatum TaxID=38727 RepID=A0A8T0V691_PANVG|nr:hypothetical protein PVAP13_2NG023714 [Panicum virgatum]